MRLRDRLLIISVLLVPSDPEVSAEYATSSKAQNYNQGQLRDVTEDTVNQIQASRGDSLRVHKSLDYLYQKDSTGSGSGGSEMRNRNSSMIVSRGGLDSRNQLPPGTSIQSQLLSSVSIETETCPLVAIVTKPVLSDSGVAIPEGAKLIGEGTFDENSDRAKVHWKSIILLDGRERSLSAHGYADGKIQSHQMRNAVGQTITKFVGAYAAGSINTGAFGANAGGHRNGLRNAIAETASERATGMAEDMQKQKKWISLEKGEPISTVLSHPFTFRDPGGVQ